jgi:hypothetical protein
MDKPKKEKWWNNTWLQGIVLAFISALAPDIIKGIPLFTTIKVITTSIQKFLTISINIQIQIGLFLLIVIPLIGLLTYTASKIKKRVNRLNTSLKAAEHKLYLIEQEKTKIPPPPEHTAYTQDTFKLWTWKWNWVYSESHKSWVVSNLKPYCPICDIEFMNKGGKYELAKCPTCERFSVSLENNPQKTWTVFIFR